MEIVFKLSKISIKPAIALTLNEANYYALYDTGADLPVWTDILENFKELYPDAELIAQDRYISGFGGKCYGSIYKINFVLAQLTFPQMPVFVPNEPLEFPYLLILPATIFEGLAYTIDTKDKSLTVNIEHQYQTVRNLKVLKEDGTIMVLSN